MRTTVLIGTINIFIMRARSPRSYAIAFYLFSNWILLITFHPGKDLTSTITALALTSDTLTSRDTSRGTTVSSVALLSVLKLAIAANRTLFGLSTRARRTTKCWLL